MKELVELVERPNQVEIPLRFGKERKAVTNAIRKNFEIFKLKQND